ncbi:hypothetical protein [Actinoplanes sp. NPDC051494]|uniref:hypothetical protein n=1 Tax=Actinoplanes sp. NPDC051494 TaxID=3363907 RepID=UPI0037B79E73
MPSPILERGLTGLFRSRWGVAFVIALLVLAVVGLGRLFSDGDDKRQLLDPVPPAATVSVDPSLDNDSVVVDDDPPQEPDTSPGTAKPEAVAYAFASAWVDHKNVSAKAWHDGIVPNATEDLSAELDGVDPADVPADRVTGRPEITPTGDGLVDAIVTVDSGKLTLQLVAPDGRWLVDGVDWEGA